ncbi:epoxyqueuosine reductase QueH [Candidatus Woesearchaeota archaeon]|nr:epoxyqueuosine reductase QueH [Candidatus Woesearchaeota archaeon]
MKKKLLLHTCCAPCSTHCVKELMDEYDVTMFFYNPNIHPGGEYYKRYANAQKVSAKMGVPLIEGAYSPQEWVELTKGFEEEPEGGRRCRICFSIRLAETARYAKLNGFDAFTTTLTISPHKDAELINGLGAELAKKRGIEWLPSDFRKKDGFRKSVQMSKEMELYRQNYCGCFYSVNSGKK